MRDRIYVLYDGKDAEMLTIRNREVFIVGSGTAAMPTTMTRFSAARFIRSYRNNAHDTIVRIA